MKNNDKNSRQLLFPLLMLLIIVGSVAFFLGLLLGIATYHFQTDKTLVQVASGPEDSQPDYQNELLDLPSEQDAENQERKENIEERTDFSVVLKNNTDEAALRARQSRRSSTPATEEQIKETLFFLPDVLAEVNGKKILKKEIVDLLLSKKVSQHVLDQTSESHLRSYMPQYIDREIDMEILKQKAKEAGFVPSEELVKTHFDYSIRKMHTEQVNDLKAQIEEQGYTLESYRNEIAKESDIQERAAIAAYEEKFFVEEAEKSVTDEAVKTFYNENKKSYRVPENITVAHILIQCEPVSELDSMERKEYKVKAERLAKEQIYNIYADLMKDPAVFNKLAQEKSDCPSGKRGSGKLPAFDKDGNLLDQSGIIDPDFKDAAFKLEKPGDFTKPVHTQFGYHIIRLLKKDSEDFLPFDKVKQEICDFLVDKAVSEEIQAMIKTERAKSDIKVYSFHHNSPVMFVHATNLK